jgi:hypothetical protein
MFYEESDIEELLKCQKCKTKYVEPRCLPCSESICSNCLEKLIEEQSAHLNGKLKCCFCDEEHDMPDAAEIGFPISKNLVRLLEKKPHDVYRGKLVEEFKSHLRIIKNEIESLKENLENGKDNIRDRCALLKHQILMRVESLVDHINKESNEMQQEIDKYEKQCIESFEKSVDTKERVKRKLSESQSFYETSSKYLCQSNIDDNQVSPMKEKAVKCLDECKLLKYDLKKLMFNNYYSEYEFKENKYELDLNLIGRIEKKALDLDSIILSDDTKRLLYELCKFEFDSSSSSSSPKWELLYRASRDGKSAKAFHHKCDNKSKTLTIIKSTDDCIFGGYTEKAWSSSNNHYKLDSKVFIFSLTNRLMMPKLLLKNDAFENTKGIFCEPSYGPTFFDKSENLSKSQLRVSFNKGNSEAYARWSNKSDINQHNYYLTSNRNFDYVEMEVFQRI